MLALAALSVSLALPLHLERNHGKSDAQVRYVGVTPDGRLELLTPRFDCAHSAIELNLPATKPQGLEQLTAKSNYYSGSRSTDWHTDIPNFGQQLTSLTRRGS